MSAFAERSHHHRQEGEITVLLANWGKGDPAALETLLPLVFHELRRIAGRYMLARARVQMTETTTSLVNDVCLRLYTGTPAGWTDRKQFFAFACKLTRDLFVDYLRKKQSKKRGGGTQILSLSDVAGLPELASRSEADVVAIISLQQALEELTHESERAVRVVELRFYGGLTEQEVAENLGVSRETVKRDWLLAKLWLKRKLEITRSCGGLVKVGTEQ